jgi:hypothetical protein
MWGQPTLLQRRLPLLSSRLGVQIKYQANSQPSQVSMARSAEGVGGVLWVGRRVSKVQNRVIKKFEIEKN